MKTLERGLADYIVVDCVTEREAMSIVRDRCGHAFYYDVPTPDGCHRTEYVAVMIMCELVVIGVEWTTWALRRLDKLGDARIALEDEEGDLIYRLNRFRR